MLLVWGLTLQTKEILRKCLATGDRLEKKDLIRIVKTKEGIIIDTSDKMKINGRGAYVKKDAAAIEILIKKDLLSRAFKEKVSNDVYEELKNILNR